ncbi:uncharacterized protein LOC110749474 [Prunus avium]|uniref:Uncharacterized protein LOC110749474 n=1 Tax=Prunus avium TaxID=42229 RepID=A0A6P5RU80_PRUAV|nr:uncharacterized protein LOC110749474 [Prunus avium]
MFRSIVGDLQYLTFTRPDIAYAVNTACQYMTAPTDVHFHLIKRILRYVQGILKHGISFTSGPWHLTAYSDADWAGDINTRRSTTGFVVFLGHNPVSWQSKKQSSVSRSSTETEYRALANSAADLFLVLQVLQDLQLDIDFHFIREKVQRKDLIVQYIPTEEQLADVLPKVCIVPFSHNVVHI